MSNNGNSSLEFIFVELSIFQKYDQNFIYYEIMNGFNFFGGDIRLNKNLIFFNMGMETHTLGLYSLPVKPVLA